MYDDTDYSVVSVYELLGSLVRSGKTVTIKPAPGIGPRGRGIAVTIGEFYASAPTLREAVVAMLSAIAPKAVDG